MATKPQKESEVENSISNEFRIEPFLKSNYKLFAILSVFGAISVYLPELGELDTNPILRVGFVSTLFLILMTAVMIDRRFFLQAGGIKGLTKSFLHPSPSTYEIILFFIPFNSLTFSLIAVSGTYTATFVYLLQFIGTSIGLVITFHMMKVLDSWRNTDTEGQHIFTSIVVAISLGVLLLMLAGIGMSSVQNISGFTSESLFTFTAQFGPFAVIYSVFFGVALAGIIYWALAILMIVFWLVEILDFVYHAIIEYISRALTIMQ